VGISGDFCSYPLPLLALFSYSHSPLLVLGVEAGCGSVRDPFGRHATMAPHYPFLFPCSSSALCPPQCARGTFASKRDGRWYPSCFAPPQVSPFFPLPDPLPDRQPAAEFEPVIAAPSVVYHLPVQKVSSLFLLRFLLAFS